MAHGGPLVYVLRFSSSSESGVMGKDMAGDLDSLVGAALGGDDRAFRALFDATYREVRLFVGARAPSLELMDEVVQAAYVIAFESLGRYRPNGNLLGWLKGIARNRLLQELDRRKRLEPIESVADHSGAEVADVDLGGRLNDCLGRLTPTARELIDLRYHQHIPVQDIAQRLGRTASSVSVSLHRLRNALATCLGPEVVGHG